MSSDLALASLLWAWHDHTMSRNQLAAGVVIPGVRTFVVTLAVSIVVLACASCAQSDGPSGGPDRTSDPLSSVAANDEGGVRDALAAAGVDVEEAPERLAAVEDWEVCGSDVRDQNDADLSDAARCFLDHHIAELDAVYVSTAPTVEGDPITTVYVSGREGAVTTFTDWSRDAFGSDGWSRENAQRLSVSTSFGIHRIELIEPTAVDVDSPLPKRAGGEAPEWFVDRQPLSWCGMDVRTIDQNFEARQCFADAVEQGVPSEYVVGQTGDEGERGIGWYRVLGPGVFEVIERHLPGSGLEAGGPPAWVRLRCTAVDLVREPGFESALLPRIDDPSSCAEASTLGAVSGPTPTPTTIAGADPVDPQPTQVESRYYVDVDLQCQAFDLDGVWVLVEGDTSTWQPSGERHEGGLFTIADPGRGRFVGNAAGDKTATFRKLSPGEAPSCVPVPRSR